MLREDIFKEIDILCGLNHENVIFLKEYYEENNKVRAGVGGKKRPVCVLTL